MRLTKEMASRPVSRKPLWTLALAMLVHVSACKTATEDDNTTNTFVQVLSVGSSAGDFALGEDGTDLFSDVCAANEDNPPCTVFNDNIIVTFAAFAKDQQVLSSAVNGVTFNRYQVTYTRADGRNVPGIDVPFPFDGVSTFTVPPDGITVERAFIVVRHQAKRESPLREISFNSSAILSVLARVDFFGTDVAGRAIKVTAFLNITFADFGND